MLVLSRKESEGIMIGNVLVVLVRSGNGSIRLGIDAPRDVKIVRAELLPVAEQQELIQRNPELIINAPPVQVAGNMRIA